MKYLRLIVFVCSIMIPVSVQGQSVNTGNPRVRHGDVENIGNRNISGMILGILPNVVSPEQETAIGQQLATELEQTIELSRDLVVTEYVDRLGQNLVRHSDAKVSFHIKLVNADAADVLAFPGGFLYVSRGLILEAESEAELASAIAHSIAHVCARHATELQSKIEYLHLSKATRSAGATLSLPVINHSYSSEFSIRPEFISMTRKCEREADQLGIQYLWNTGYDPNAIVSLIEKMQVREKADSGRSAAFFRAYPSADRIPQCLEEQRALPKKNSYITGSSEFDRIKARLLANK